MTTKMDVIWLAAASLLHPTTSTTKTVTRGQIQEQVATLFGASITAVMVAKHLVSWEDRQADKANPSRGGSRNRYLFKTADGRSPTRSGDFRLYKTDYGPHDGWEKTGPTCPGPDAVPAEYCHLITWYEDHFIDQDAIPTLVEVKRSTDTRIRREVVGQMLEYAANAVLYWPMEKLRARFEMTATASGAEAGQVLAEFLGTQPLDRDCARLFRV